MRREKINFVSSVCHPIPCCCCCCCSHDNGPALGIPLHPPSHHTLPFHSSISIHCNLPLPSLQVFLVIPPSCSAPCPRPYLLHQGGGVDDQHSVLGAAPQLAAHRHHLGDGAAGCPQSQRLGGLGVPEASWMRRVKSASQNWQMATAILPI